MTASRSLPEASNSPVVARNDYNLISAYLNKIAPDLTDTLLEVARCESGYQQKWNYMNPTGDLNSKWSAYGYFQITKGTAFSADPTLDRFDPYENIELAVKIYRNRGISPWYLSEGCHKQS